MPAEAGVQSVSDRIQLHRALALRQALVFLYGNAGCFLRLAPAHPGRYRAEEGQKRVSFGHMSVSWRVVRVELDSLMVVVDAFLQIEIIEVVVCPQVVLVRFDVHCLHLWRRGWLRTAQSAFDLLGDGRRYLILQGEHVGEVAFIRIGPEMPIVGGADQLGSDAYTIAGALYRAFDYGVGIEFT